MFPLRYDNIQYAKKVVDLGVSASVKVKLKEFVWDSFWWNITSRVILQPSLHIIRVNSCVVSAHSFQLIRKPAPMF